MKEHKEKAEAEQEYKLLSKVVTKSLERTQDWIRNKSRDTVTLTFI